MSRLTLTRSSLLYIGVMLVTVNEPAFLVCNSSWYIIAVTALPVLFKRTLDAAGTEPGSVLVWDLERCVCLGADRGVCIVKSPPCEVKGIILDSDLLPCPFGGYKKAGAEV